MQKLKKECSHEFKFSNLPKSSGHISEAVDQPMTFSDKAFKSNLDLLHKACENPTQVNGDNLNDWNWHKDSDFGQLTLILTKIEWHLKATFGEHLDKPKSEILGDLLSTMIDFYKGGRRIKYKNFCTM